MPSQMKDIVTSYIASGNSNPLSIRLNSFIIFPSKHISQLQLRISGFLETYSLHVVAFLSFVFLLISNSSTNISITLVMAIGGHGRGSRTSIPGTSKFW